MGDIFGYLSLGSYGLITTMVFHVIDHGLSPCGNDDDIYCIYFKYYFLLVLCVFLQNLLFIGGLV